MPLLHCGRLATADMIFNDMSAFEQIGLHKYLDLVVTHKFHDAVFAFTVGGAVAVVYKFTRR